MELSARFDRAGPRRELVDCDDEVADIRFLLAGTSGWLLPTTLTTEYGGGGSGCLWENDVIMFLEVPVDPFHSCLLQW